MNDIDPQICRSFFGNFQDESFNTVPWMELEWRFFDERQKSNGNAAEWFENNEQGEYCAIIYNA